jgi:hypothetical protein
MVFISQNSKAFIITLDYCIKKTNTAVMVNVALSSL